MSINKALFITLVNCLQQAQLTRFKEELNQAAPADLEAIGRNIAGENTGFNMVHYCAYEHNGPKFLEAMLEKFPALDLNLPATTSGFGRQPALVVASAFAHWDIMEVLIKHGAAFTPEIQKACKAKVKEFFEEDEMEEFKELSKKWQSQSKASKPKL